MRTLTVLLAAAAALSLGATCATTTTTVPARVVVEPTTVFVYPGASAPNADVPWTAPDLADGSQYPGGCYPLRLKWTTPAGAVRDVEVRGFYAYTLAAEPPGAVCLYCANAPDVCLAPTPRSAEDEPYLVEYLAKQGRWLDLRP